MEGERHTASVVSDAKTAAFAKRAAAGAALRHVISSGQDLTGRQ